MSWHQQAACRGLDPELFHPRRGESTAMARATCAACPVRTVCTEHAVSFGERHGVWGGTSERQRRRLRAERRLGAAGPVGVAP